VKDQTNYDLTPLESRKKKQLRHSDKIEDRKIVAKKQ
jgi:hypothetical protein